MKSSPQPRVAIYGRFSSTRQNLSSADDQLRQCEERVMLNGWTIKHRFSDDAISGTDNKRPGYLELNQAIQNGNVDIVLTESLSRLSRNQSEIAKFYEDCQYHETRIITLSEGEITRMHVGMLGTMNAVFLENLAESTYRGLESRIIEGRSAGGRAYGYRVPKYDDGNRKKGELEVIEEEAEVIRRIMSDYAKGLSPRAIAAALNAEGIASPQGKSKGKTTGDGKWRANTILGNRQRGTGIINNELYVGKRIWNRLHYFRKPGTKQRHSRLNPPSEWRVDDVAHLRIVSDELWAQVRDRQSRLDSAREAKDTGDHHHLSGSHASKRPTYLLSGLLRCGCCGGTMNIGGSNPKRYYCANAREKGQAVCKGIPGIAQHTLEATVLNGVRAHLMQPAAVADYIHRYQQHQAKLSADKTAKHNRLLTALTTAKTEIANIMTAIKAGIITSSTKAELEALEAKKVKIEQDITSNATALPTLPSDLAERYRDSVERLVPALNDPETRHLATDAIRGMLDRIVVHWDDDAKSHTIEIEGKLVALLTLAQNENAAAFGAAASSLKMVAGAGFEPATFRL